MSVFLSTSKAKASDWTSHGSDNRKCT